MAPKKAAPAKSATRKVVVRPKAKAAKPVAKKAPVAIKAKAVAKKATSIIKEAYNKTKLLTSIAEEVGLSRKQVSEVFESLSNIIERHVKKTGAGEFTLPGLAKVKVVHKPATKARAGINPFNGEKTVFKAKPARNVVKIKALKKLKEMVA